MRTPDMPVLLGIDLGTSAVKVLVVEADGEVLGRGSATYDIQWVRDGWAEQDPAAWWEATGRAAGEALSQARAARGAGMQVAAVGLSGQVNGIVPIDAEGRVLRPALIWLDQRATAEADEINRTAADLLQEAALGQAGPIHSASKLMWLLRHEPDVLSRAWKVLAPKDVITHRLTGRAVTDVTDAGASLLLDMRHRAWASAVLNRLGIPPVLLPDVVESPTAVGTVRASAAEVLGIAAGTPVVAGAGDMAAITAGTGAITPGIACIMIGTAGQIALSMAGQPRMAPPGVWAMTAPIPGGYFWHGLVMTAGYCLAWLGNLLAGGTGSVKGDETGGDAADIAALAEGAADSPPGGRGLIFLPFLDGAATPHADAQARGVLFGATSTHGRGDIVRAVMEGVAYNFRDAFKAFAALGERATRIRIGGGGSRSTVWQQILADVLETDLEVLAEHDASAFGAAVIAAVGAAVHPDFDHACRAMIRPKGTVHPNLGHRDLYAGQYALYRELYQKTRDIAHALGNISRQGGENGG